MVVIRLARTGAKARPFFNIVVVDSRVRRDGKFIERIGFYNPKAAENDEMIRFDTEKYNNWISKGAKPSNTVKRILRQSKKTVN